MITQQRLKELLIYDPNTGWFTNRVDRGHCKAGDRAGTVHAYGYRQIRIFGYTYKEHRLAWLYTYGHLPNELDHKDGVRWHNAISNLREVTRSQNNANADRQTGIAGLRGVTWFVRNLKWKAQIKIGGQCVHLGYFDTVEEAHVAYLNAADTAYGEHAYHNRIQPFERRI